MAGETQRKLTLIHTDSANGARHKASVFFADRVLRYTDGQCSVGVHHQGANDDLAALAQLRAGIIDFTMASAGVYGQFVESLNLTALPYLVDNLEQGWALYDQSTWLKEQFDLLTAKEIRWLGNFEAGFRNFTTNAPLRSPADARGMKMRIFKNELIATIMETIGFETVAMGVGDTYAAIEDGLVDGQENPIDTIYSQRFYTVAPYLAMTRHIYGPLPFCISERSWASLSNDHQEAIRAAARDAAEFSRRMVRNLEEFQINEIRIKGATLINPDIDIWRSVLLPVHDQAVARFENVNVLLDEAAAIRTKLAA